MTELERMATEHMNDKAGPSDTCKNCQALKYASFMYGADQMRALCAKEAAHLFEGYGGQDRHMSTPTFEAAIMRVGTTEERD